MGSTLNIGIGLGVSSSIFHLNKTTLKPPPPLPISSSNPHFTISTKPHYSSCSNHPSSSHILHIIRASSSSSSSNSTPPRNRNPIIIQKLKTTATAVILATATALVAVKFQQLPARAETRPTIVVTEEQITTVNNDENVQNQQQQQEEEEEEEEKLQDDQSTNPPSPPLSQFLQSNPEAVDALKSMLEQKLEAGEDEEALKLLKKLVSAQPQKIEWKFLMGRLLDEMGSEQEARDIFEEILKLNPLSYQALFENALLMDRCGEGTSVMIRLEEALRIAEQEGKESEARDVRLIMAQVQFLQKNVDEALRSYEELAREDPNDYRPYFCKGMIYTLLDRDKEAKEEFAKYRKLAPKKFEVEGYLRTALSRMKLFGTTDD